MSDKVQDMSDKGKAHYIPDEDQPPSVEKKKDDDRWKKVREIVDLTVSLHESHLLCGG